MFTRADIQQCFEKRNEPNDGHALLAYLTGETAPRYPVPTLLGPVNFWWWIGRKEPTGLDLDHADKEWELQPIITWWNAGLGVEIPEDSGVADYIGN